MNKSTNQDAAGFHDIPDEDWDYLISKPRVFSVWAFDPDNPLELCQRCLRFEDHQEKGLQVKVISKDEVAGTEVIPCIIEKDVILPLNWNKNGFPKKEAGMMILGCKFLQSWSNKIRAEQVMGKPDESSNVSLGS